MVDEIFGDLRLASLYDALDSDRSDLLHYLAVVREFKATSVLDVGWILGDATTLPTLAVDIATMTGNVAQVFLTDEAWTENLEGIHRSLAPDGRLVFEVRDPAQRGWEEWTRDLSIGQTHIDGVGAVDELGGAHGRFAADDLVPPHLSI